MSHTDHSKEFALAGLIGELMDVSYDDPQLNQWLEKCAVHLGCSGAALVSWDDGDPENQHSVIYGSHELVNDSWSGWFNELMSFYIPNGPCLLEDIMVDLYNARSYSCDYDLEGLISMAPALGQNKKIGLISWSRDIVFVVFEHSDGTPWTQDDAEMIRFLLEHMRKAHKLISHVYNCRWGSAIASTILDSAPRGLSVIQPDGHIGYATHKGRVILDQQDGISLQKGYVRLEDADAEQELYKELKKLHHDGTGTFNMAIERPSGKPAFQLMLAAMQTSIGQSASIRGQTFLTLYLHNPTEQIKLSIEQLQKYFGLTKAEAKVARNLFRLDNMQAAANDLGISINTARTHLRRVYEKTNVSSQSELMRALSGALRTQLVDDDKASKIYFAAPPSKMSSGWRK